VGSGGALCDEPQRSSLDDCQGAVYIAHQHWDAYSQGLDTFSAHPIVTLAITGS